MYKSGEPVFVYRVLISDWRLVAIELNFRIIKNMYRDIKGWITGALYTLKCKLGADPPCVNQTYELVELDLDR